MYFCRTRMIDGSEGISLEHLNRSELINLANGLSFRGKLACLPPDEYTDIRRSIAAKLAQEMS